MPYLFQSLSFFLLTAGQTLVQITTGSKIQYIPEISGMAFLFIWMFSIHRLFKQFRSGKEILVVSAVVIAGIAKTVHVVSNYFNNVGVTSLSYFNLVFLDEVASHWVALSMYLIISFLFLLSKIKNDLNISSLLMFSTTLISGVSLFLFLIESKTVALFFSIILIFAIASHTLKKELDFSNNLNRYFLFHFFTAAVLTLIYGLVMKGFPEFSELGII